MSKNLAIIGAGELGKQIAHIAISNNLYNNIIYFDDYYDEEIFNGYKVVGSIKILLASFKKGLFDEVIIGIGYHHMAFRESLFQKIKDYKIPFGKVIHSSVIIDSTAKIGDGVIIYPGVIIDSNVKLKDNVLLNVGVSISHDTIINSHCFISPRVALAGFIVIGQKCILGVNSTIIDGVTISDSIQIGGGTVVIKNLIKQGLYVGNPARFIR